MVQVWSKLIHGRFHSHPAAKDPFPLRTPGGDVPSPVSYFRYVFNTGVSAASGLLGCKKLRNVANE
eukprot:scaffold143_cov260-Pinguiococcus_pyrenoidosus.AAC.32